MDEMIRQEIHKEANRCPVQSIPWENIRDRALDNTSFNTSFQRKAIIRKIGYGFAAMVVIGGCLIMSGLIFPVIAGALERIPVINVVFNFVGDRGIQNAIDKGFSTKVNRTATDKDISVTITEVLYDQGRIDIGYTVTTSRPDLYLKDVWPYSIPLLIADMQLFIDGKAIHATRQATAERIENGNVGLVEIYPRGDLPETFDLQIVIRQIDNQQGEWLLGPIPVSRKDTDAATRIFSPMKTEAIGQTIITVKKVKITPLSTIIDYELAQPIADEYSNLDFYATDDKEHLLGTSCGSLVNRQIRGNMTVSNFQSIYESPESIPKYLVLILPKVGYNHTDSQLQRIKVPLE
ncbi:DUF4179 domain-containing protein [Pelotomaculum propionicicum]|uniref:DUF4179 domain-containing protein n=1 Tax=Pelotomaculum propionicicum TaxID=258475 RepID=A0A4Y7RCK5_9FIRM|nr:DUF4179 domain-containing protein [Pelotomaculum propionicicum]NLI14365.1 DUF4179 domain-containing protein [Peptococcaceae bacterium]TEB06460.1 hypothetical protein Pmgp_03718 [Pelotomaculum propionicicum]